MKEKISTSKEKMRHYVLVGDEKSWRVAIEKNQWGFSEKNKGLWNTIKEGELVAFYVTSPTQKIIGFGRISEKFVSKDLLWPDEKLFKKSIWGNRIKLNVDLLVKNWNDGVKPPSDIMLNVGRKVIPEKIFKSILKDAEKKWNVKTE